MARRTGGYSGAVPSTKTNCATFGDLEIVYDDRVLPPRPWTVMQSAWAIALSPSLSPGPILELCAGTGQIGLLVARQTGRPLVQVEADAVAAKFAVANARAAGVADHRVRCAALDQAVSSGDCFPLIVADPPYVRSDDVAKFPDDPPEAIDGGPDGLVVVRQCLAVAERALDDGGMVLVQVRGEAQAGELDGIAQANGTALRVAEVRAHDEDRAVALLRRD